MSFVEWIHAGQRDDVENRLERQLGPSLGQGDFRRWSRVKTNFGIGKNIWHGKQLKRCSRLHPESKVPTPDYHRKIVIIQEVYLVFRVISG